MVFCCVPGCGTDSSKCDPTVTFHDVPHNQAMSARWLKQVTSAVKSGWIPKIGDVFCSKHFLETDFKENTDVLKPHCVPTIFGHRFIGEDADHRESKNEKQFTSSPMIVKVVNPLPQLVIKNVRTVSHVSFQDEPANAVVNRNVCKIPIAGTSVKPLRPILKKNSVPMIPSRPSQSSLTKHVSKNKSISPDATGHSLPKPFITVSNLATDPFKVQTIFHRQSAEVCEVGKNTPQTVPKQVNPKVPLKPVSDPEKSNQSKPAMKRNFSGDLSQPSNRKREKLNNDLIEISPNTFLKINPDIIKVNKKLTPSGNTVLQFLMDPKVANSEGINILPKIVHGQISNKKETHSNGTIARTTTSNDLCKVGQNFKTDNQQIVGHHQSKDLDVSNTEMVDGCDTSSDDSLKEKSDASLNSNGRTAGTGNKSPKADSSGLEKKPFLLTTKMPISNCFYDEAKNLVQMKQKGRQVAALKTKISSMQKKIDELEDKVIVQERQLSYSFIKRLKTIRKNSSKGDPCATYILEQIRSYTDNSKMRWSDSTLAQSAIWCRKAPYAYEYFKKAEFFKLPCLGTVKRFMKKHPDIDELKKIIPNPQGDDESSSDFDFDESDPESKGLSEDENDESHSSKPDTSKKSENDKDLSVNPGPKVTVSQPNITVNAGSIEKNMTGIPLTVTNPSMEIQEIMLPTGEIVQCYSSSVSSSSDGQYYIIPNVNDPNADGDHEFTMVRADSMPVVLQNFDPAQQENLIFIANAANQVQCSETVVST